MNDGKIRKIGRSALGRGLSALVSSQAKDSPRTDIQTSEDRFAAPGMLGSLAISSAPSISSPRQEYTQPTNQIDIDRIIANPSQPRRSFDQTELNELAESIRSVGLIQPIVVRVSQASPDSFEIVAGERRWRASKLAGLTKVPVIIETYLDKEALEVALIENIQRSNLNPIEEAYAYKRLVDEYALSQKELAERVGKDRASVANILRLLTLPEQLIEMVRSNKISVGHAKAILSVREPSAQISLAKKTINEGLSVRALEATISRIAVLDVGKRSPNAIEISKASTSTSKSTAFPETADRLRQTLGTKILIKHTKSGHGKIEIEYFSEQELERLVDQICR